MPASLRVLDSRLCHGSILISTTCSPHEASHFSALGVSISGPVKAPTSAAPLLIPMAPHTIETTTATMAVLKIQPWCRLVLQKLEVAISVDAVVSAVRAYLERSCRELLAKGPSSQASQPEQGEDELQEQLAILSSWHAWLLGHLRHFKVCAIPWPGHYTL